MTEEEVIETCRLVKYAADAIIKSHYHQSLRLNRTQLIDLSNKIERAGEDLGEHFVFNTTE